MDFLSHFTSLLAIRYPMTLTFTIYNAVSYAELTNEGISQKYTKICIRYEVSLCAQAGRRALCKVLAVWKWTRNGPEERAMPGRLAASLTGHQFPFLACAFQQMVSPFAFSLRWYQARAKVAKGGTPVALHWSVSKESPPLAIHRWRSHCLTYQREIQVVSCCYLDHTDCAVEWPCRRGRHGG